VRPRGKAGRKSRHNMINGGQTNAWGLIGRSSDQARAFPAGVRSPPLRLEADPNAGCLAGKGLGTTLKAVFSEGRTLCVRDYGPDASRDIT